MKEIFNKIKRYNTWGGKIINAGYEHVSYFNRITSYTDNKLVKVLVGQRRVGKSLSVLKISKQHPILKNYFPITRKN